MEGALRTDQVKGFIETDSHIDYIDETGSYGVIATKREGVVTVIPKILHARSANDKGWVVSLRANLKACLLGVFIREIYSGEDRLCQAVGSQREIIRKEALRVLHGVIQQSKEEPNEAAEPLGGWTTELSIPA